MIDVTITLQNDEVGRMRSWIEAQERELTDLMMAPTATRATEQANTVFRLLRDMDQQLHGFQLLLTEKEEAARTQRRKR